MPGAHAIERYLVEESIGRILEAHYKDRKEWYVPIFLLHAVINWLFCY